MSLRWALLLSCLCLLALLPTFVYQVEGAETAIGGNVFGCCRRRKYVDITDELTAAGFPVQSVTRTRGWSSA